MSESRRENTPSPLGDIARQRLSMFRRNEAVQYLLAGSVGSDSAHGRAGRLAVRAVKTFRDRTRATGAVSYSLSDLGPLMKALPRR
jgi:hypothetical protein